MKTITRRQVLLLHRQLSEETGGSDGLRECGLMESALAAPFQSFGGVDAYPSLQEKAARLGYGFIKNHPFVDGNKRIGVHLMLLFLAMNGVNLEYSQEELSTIILSVASGLCGYDGLLDWIMSHEQRES